jgi:hypothetical protein
MSLKVPTGFTPARLCQLPRKSLVGQTFGFLTVLSFAGRCRFREAAWLCECRCGSMSYVRGVQLTGGKSKSCGCLRDEHSIGDVTRSHGATKTPTYGSWVGMRRRCLSPTTHNYQDYGGRGVTIWGPWDDFEVFLKDMGERPQGTSLDRFPNPYGNYEPRNCRWATPLQQSRNRRKRRWQKRPPSSVRR